MIAIKAASLNFPDLLTVQNKYQFKPPLPFVPGSEYAGVVEAVGEGVKHLKVGDAVAAIGSSGGFATHACVAAAGVMPLPPGFAFDDAAAFVMTYGTTHHALVDRAQLKAGETLLVLGAAGGVGSAAIQLGKDAGARVIAVAGGTDKHANCRELGADAVIDSASTDLAAEVR
ncbi:MAG TPA: alcohol dehydrogenase catalytic domain-containing protein, partial [Vicinamibacterales bacterium]|nr:alcohol dehydrogenase catalytic domain-containing protein [Vicinamibacterales bacterium]